LQLEEFDLQARSSIIIFFLLNKPLNTVDGVINMTISPRSRLEPVVGDGKRHNNMEEYKNDA